MGRRPGAQERPCRTGDRTEAPARRRPCPPVERVGNLRNDDPGLPERIGG
jgi:hypothetical protein